MNQTEKNYWRALKRRYGLDRGGYDRLWLDQRGLCPVCGKPLKPRPSRDTHVDHDHETGAVRGLLCHYCNTRLGWYEASRARIEHYLDSRLPKEHA